MSRRRKAQSKAKENITFLSDQLRNNKAAMEEAKIKKKWSKLDLKPIKALTPGQEDMFHSWYNDQHICAYGSAGTGKTFIAMYLALQEILDGRYHCDHIIIVRSNVPTREVGFLPGTLEEKMSAYEVPYIDICEELIGRASTYEDMKRAGLITFMPTSFLRGVTWHNAIIIVDECENMNMSEINTIMTRMGSNSRMIVCGDLVQTDLPTNGRDTSGMQTMLHIIENMEYFDTTKFTKHDIVRDNFVKEWITHAEKYLTSN